LGYGPDVVDQYRRVATYIDRILHGAKPADLPLQAPTRFELALNLRTAKAIGLTIAHSLLVRADEVMNASAWITRDAMEGGRTVRQVLRLCR
jgi:putative ABC transport system substrate-binding protein